MTFQDSREYGYKVGLSEALRIVKAAMLRKNREDQADLQEVAEAISYKIGTHAPPRASA